MGQKGSHASQEQINEYYQRRHSFAEKPEDKKAKAIKKYQPKGGHRKSMSKDLSSTKPSNQRISEAKNQQDDNFLRLHNHEIALVDDPGERDYYSTCPNCSAKILETGLETQIVCTCCNYKFKSNANAILRIHDGEIEQRYLNRTEHERLKKSMSLRASMPSNLHSHHMLENAKEEDEEYEEEEEEDDYYGQYDGSPNPFQIGLEEIIDREESKVDYNEHPLVQNQSKELQTVTLLVIQESLLDDFLIKDKNEQKRELNNIGEVKTEITGSDKKNNLQGEEEEDKAEQEEDKNEEDGQVEEQKIESPAIEDDSELQGGPEERIAKKSLRSVKFDLLMKQILLPFFQIQTKILCKGNIFEIGSIKFLVAATTPYKQGKVGKNTKIRCNMCVSENSELESVELVPLRRNQINSNSTFLNEVVSPFLRSLKPKEVYTHKHASIELDDVKLLIKYSRPYFGYFTENTRVKVDDYAKPLHFIRIAPIWKDEKTCKKVNQNFTEYENYMREQYLNIYFHSGLSRFVEKGETILIENIEFFVNDCRPKNGYVEDRTNIEIQTGFTKENFNKKQIQADKNFARRLQSKESNRSQLYQFTQALGRNATPELIAQLEQELMRGRGPRNANELRQRMQAIYQYTSHRSKRKPASKSLVQSLPERTLTKKFIDEKKFDNEEAYIKCLICLEYYVVDENVKTLPCMHYFHKGCIENWFSRGRTCPVCKWDITKDLDASQFEEVPSPQPS